MKLFNLLLCIIIIMNTPGSQNKVTVVDLERYSGKWYVIATIPTNFDKNWDYTTESYSLTKEGEITIYTTYRKKGELKERSVRSKGFPVKETHNVHWKVQFVWPFKADYLIEELPPEYSYVVVGHPKRKFLYIMNRTGKMGSLQYDEIIERCRQKGYDLSKLQKVKQGF